MAGQLEYGQLKGMLKDERVRIVKAVPYRDESTQENRVSGIASERVFVDRDGVSFGGVAKFPCVLFMRFDVSLEQARDLGIDQVKMLERRRTSAQVFLSPSC